MQRPHVGTTALSAADAESRSRSLRAPGPCRGECSDLLRGPGPLPRHPIGCLRSVRRSLWRFRHHPDAPVQFRPDRVCSLLLMFVGLLHGQEKPPIRAQHGARPLEPHTDRGSVAPIRSWKSRICRRASANSIDRRCISSSYLSGIDTFTHRPSAVTGSVGHASKGDPTNATCRACNAVAAPDHHDFRRRAAPRTPVRARSAASECGSKRAVTAHRTPFSPVPSTSPARARPGACSIGWAVPRPRPARPASRRDGGSLAPTGRHRRAWTRSSRSPRPPARRA